MKTRLKEQSLKRILLIMASILVLSMLIPLSLCADQNNSTLSGLVFNDVNGNGERALSSENGLGNWTVYVDLNRNYKQDNGDLFNQSDSSGYYIITNIPNGTYTVREIVKDGWTKTTQNSDRIKFSGPDKLEMNFGNRENKASSASSTFQDKLFNFSFGGAIFCFLAGFLLFLLGWGQCSIKDITKDKGKMGMILGGVFLIILGAYFLHDMEKISGIAVPSISSQFSSIPMWLMVTIFVLLFVILLAIGICKPEQMEGGQMRRAIAGMLVFGFITILMFALYGAGITDDNKEVISQYIQLVGIIIGFYFGAKITTDATGKMSAQYDPTKTSKDPLEIGDPSKLDGAENGNKIEIPVTNKSGHIIKVTNVNLKGLEGSDLDLKSEVNQHIETESDKIIVDLGAQMGKINKKYTITAWVSDGPYPDKKVDKVVTPK